MKIKEWMEEHKEGILIGASIFGIGIIGGIVGDKYLSTVKIQDNKTLPMYNLKEAVSIVVTNTGVDRNTVVEVLKANDMYMAALGIVEGDTGKIGAMWDSLREVVSPNGKSGRFPWGD